jgi:hypothetical protein
MKRNIIIITLLTFFGLSNNLTAQASNFLWANQMEAGVGITGAEQGYSIAVEGNENVYITGYFYETAGFNTGSNNHNMPSAGLADIFVSKLDVSCYFKWTKQMGGITSMI